MACRSSFLLCCPPCLPSLSNGDCWNSPSSSASSRALWNYFLLGSSFHEARASFHWSPERMSRTRWARAVCLPTPLYSLYHSMSASFSSFFSCVDYRSPCQAHLAFYHQLDYYCLLHFNSDRLTHWVKPDPMVYPSFIDRLNWVPQLM